MTDRDDPELGRVRQCRRCLDWWPLDGEFYDSIGNGRGRRSTCRACRMDCVRQAQQRRRQRHAVTLNAKARERYWAKKATVAA